MGEVESRRAIELNMEELKEIIAKQYFELRDSRDRLTKERIPPRIFKLLSGIHDQRIKFLEDYILKTDDLVRRVRESGVSLKEIAKNIRRLDQLFTDYLCICELQKAYLNGNCKFL